MGTLQVLKASYDWGNYYIFSFKEILSFCRVGVYNNESGIGYLSDLVIDDNIRGNGYGTFMLREINKYMSSIGVSEIQLTTNNESLRKWYEREGYNIQKIDYTLSIKI